MKDYKHFFFFQNPDSMLENTLIVSDGMGSICDQSFIIDRSYLNNHLIMVVQRGTLHVEQYGKSYELKAGQGIIMTLTNPHKYWFDQSEKTHILWFHFRGTPVLTLIETLKVQAQLPLIVEALAMDQKIYDLFQLSQKMTTTKAFPMSGLIYSLLMTATKDVLLNKPTGIGNQALLKEEMATYISQHLTSPISLDEMAEHFHMSRSGFNRSFKKHFQTTLFAYIRTKKIELAKKMLLTSGYSIAEISNYLAYYDQGYFSTTFKSVTGMTPSHYRTKGLE